MFAFLTPHTKESADPLQNVKAAASWLQQLPALDVIARLEHVVDALDGMRKAQPGFDLNRVSAIELVDATLGADRRQLLKQYIENADSAPKLAARIWQALWELSQAFTLGYQGALVAAIPQAANARWKTTLPLLFARLIHFHGADTKLRVFKYERWIPAKWIELHQAYLRACELQCDRQAMALPAAAPPAQAWTVEQEYVFVLLMHQLNTGNLAPPEIDWASLQLRAWTRRLTVEEIPKSTQGFCVDLAGCTGLVRRGSEDGLMLRYLDTMPLAEAMDRAIATLRGEELLEQGPVTAIHQERLTVLRKILPALAPASYADLRRHPRTTVAVSARVRVGLSRICQDLTAKTADDSAADAKAEQIEVFPVTGALRVKRKPVVENDSLAVTLSSWSDPTWQVKDRSIAGLRIAATGGIGQSLALGALVAVRQSDVAGWLLGVVRRLNKVSNEEVEAGVNIIAERVVAVTLAAKRKPHEEMGYVVDGLDVSTMGQRFDGLYLLPPSRPDKPLTMKTLIVPTSQYAEDRNAILFTANSVYTVAFRHLIEQRPEWSWAAIQIIEKTARES